MQTTATTVETTASTDFVGTVVPTAVEKPTVNPPPEVLFNDFIYDSKSLACNFAANMGDSAAFKTVGGQMKYKARIVPAAPVSEYSAFLSNSNSLACNFAANMGDSASFKTTDGQMKYKARIVPAITLSCHSEVEVAAERRTLIIEER